jgi:preprotein translocase subunit SecE
MARKDDEKDDDELLDEEESSEREDASESEAEESDESDDADESDESDDADESDEKEAAPASKEEAELAAEARALANADLEAETRIVESMGATRYVHAAFFGAGILIAYLSSKLLTALWNSLADWPAATRAVPLLLRYAEEERGTYMQVAGAVLGIALVFQTYRKENIRRWANEVALEMSKVTWPSKETVQNGTVVVIVCSLIATVYVAVLDRVWGFLTHLVYGA